MGRPLELLHIAVRVKQSHLMDPLLSAYQMEQYHQVLPISLFLAYVILRVLQIIHIYMEQVEVVRAQQLACFFIQMARLKMDFTQILWVLRLLAQLL